MVGLDFIFMPQVSVIPWHNKLSNPISWVIHISNLDMCINNELRLRLLKTLNQSLAHSISIQVRNRVWNFLYISCNSKTSWIYFNVKIFNWFKNYKGRQMIQCNPFLFSFVAWKYHFPLKKHFIPALSKQN